jgi:hypothetical protein
LGISAAWSEDDLELIKAKAAYEDVVAKQKDLLKTAFEREVIKVARTGKLNLVEEIKLEQTEFLESGELPESAGMKTHVQKYKKAVETARDRLESTYEKRVIALTKAAKLDEAKAAQNELKKILSGSMEKEEEPVNEPVPQNEPAPDDQQAISLISAIWKQDGVLGTASDRTLNATHLVRTELYSKGRFDINNGTLGNLDGRPATKSLFIHLLIFRNPVHLQLSEYSSIAFGTLGPADARKPGVRMGNTRLELFEVLWKTREGKLLADCTEEVTKLMQEGPLEIRGELFPDNLAAGESKVALFRFRAGPQTVEFSAATNSIVVFPMNAAIKYTTPWMVPVDESPLKIDDTPLKVGFQNVKWMLTDGGDDSNVTQKAAALLNTRKAISCDQTTFGRVGQTKGPRMLDLDMVVNDAKFHLCLVEGSHVSIEDANEQQLNATGETIPGTPVVIVDVWWTPLNEMGGMSGTAMTQELWKHPCRIEPPILEDKTNPGQIRKAVIRLRVGRRILKIGAMTGSTFEIMTEERFEPGTFQVTTDPPTGTYPLELLANGKFTQNPGVTGTWEQDANGLTLTFTDPNYGDVQLKIVDRDHLTGPNTHRNGNQWTWTAVRTMTPAPPE